MLSIRGVSCLILLVVGHRDCISPKQHCHSQGFTTTAITTQYSQDYLLPFRHREDTSTLVISSRDIKWLSLLTNN